MPRYVCLLETEAIANFRAEIRNDRFDSTYPSRLQLESDPIPVGFAVLHRFDAPDGDSARRYYDRCCKSGCPTNPSFVGDAGHDPVPDARPWRFRGDVHHLKKHLKDAGLPQGTDKLVQANPQFRVITTVLGQQCRMYHNDCRKVGGVAVLTPQQRAGVVDSLRKAEEQVAVLGLLTMGAADAVDGAYRAFGIEHGRKFRIVVDGEPAAEPTPAPPPSPAPDPEPTSPPTAPAQPNRRPHKQAPAGV